MCTVKTTSKLTAVSQIFRIRLFVFVYSFIRSSCIRIRSLIRKHSSIRILPFIRIRLFVYAYSFIRFSCQIGSCFNCILHALPGIYFAGFSRYIQSVSTSHVIPAKQMINKHFFRKCLFIP